MKNKNKNVDVAATGLTGYVGATTLWRYLEAGYSVRILTRNQSNIEAFGKYKNHPNLEIVQCRELSEDSLVRLFEGARIRLHAAAIASPAWVSENPQEAHEANIELTKRIINVANKLDADAPLVFFSSLSVYGNHEELCYSHTTPNPNTEYGKQKYECEALLAQSVKNFTIIRPGTCVGTVPNFTKGNSSLFRDDLFINHVVKEAVQQDLGNVVAYFGANQWRPYVHIDDLGRLVVYVTRLLLEQNKSLPKILNVVSPKGNLTKLCIADAIKEIHPDFAIDLSQSIDQSDPRDYKVASELQDIGFSFLHDDLSKWVKELTHYYQHKV